MIKFDFRVSVLFGIRAEDELVELFWESGQLVRRSHTQRPTSDKPSPPPILRGSGSGGGGIENAPLPQPPLPLQPSHQNLFIQEDEMASWLHHPYSEDYFRSDLLYSGVASTPPQSSVSLAPSPTTQTIRPNFMNFSRLIGRVEAGPSIPVARASTQVDSSATPSSSAIESCLTPAHVFPIPGITRKGKAVAVETVCQIVGASSSGTPKAEPEPIQIQPPATETEFADDRKRKEKEETNDEVEKNKQGRGSTSRKRSRAAEMHNIAERRRRGKINEKMKALQQLIPRCNKSDKASTLDDAIEYVKSLQLQIQMLSTGVHPANMAMGMERPPFIPFPRQGHMAGVGPSYPPPRYPLTNIQTSDPSRVHLPTTQHPNPMLNQPQFMGYMNPYSQFHRMQQPPPLQNQTTSQLSSSQATSSKQPEDQENQPTD